MPQVLLCLVLLNFPIICLNGEKDTWNLEQMCNYQAFKALHLDLS